MSAYNLGALKNKVKKKLQVDPFFTDDDIVEAINKGIDDIIMFSKFTRDVSQAETQVGLREYALPADFLAMHGVSWNGRPLREMTLDEWMNTGGDSNTGVGVPRQYFVRNNEFVTIYPAPTQAKTLQLFYTSKPPDLVEDDEVPIIPRTSADCIVSYAVADLLEDDNELEKSGIYWAKYQKQRAEASGELRTNTKRKVRRVI